MDVTNGRSVDWERIERLPEFRELVARRRRFVVPATAFFLIWYFGFIVLAGYAEDFMGRSSSTGLHGRLRARADAVRHGRRARPGVSALLRAQPRPAARAHGRAGEAAAAPGEPDVAADPTRFMKGASTVRRPRRLHPGRRGSSRPRPGAQR